MSSEEQHRRTDREPEGETEATDNETKPGAGNGGDSEPIEEPQGSASDPASAEPVETNTADAEDSPEEPRDAGSELEAVIGELEEVRRERDGYLDSLRRLKAEFENSRKRQDRERERILQYASEKLVKELLPVLDNLDRALEVEGDLRDGVRATREHFVDVLGREGLASVASDGQAFDPNVHEAVMGQPSDEHEEGTILQTFQRGYLLNGKPIRPAKVVVAKQV